MTPERIAALKHYLSVNGVKYQDIQVELVDHFATAIEGAERDKAEITFKEALIKAHRSFGGKVGFRKYIKAAEKRVLKKIWQLVGNVLMQFLRWPYFVFTVLFVGFWYYVVSNSSTFYAEIFLVCILVLLLSTLYNTWRLRKSEFFLAKRSGNAMGWIIYCILYVPGQPIWFGNNPSLWYQTVIFTLFSLLLIATFQLPKLVRQETESLYHEIA